MEGLTLVVDIRTPPEERGDLGGDGVEPTSSSSFQSSSQPTQSTRTLCVNLGTVHVGLHAASLAPGVSATTVGTAHEAVTVSLRGLGARLCHEGDRQVSIQGTIDDVTLCHRAPEAAGLSTLVAIQPRGPKSAMSSSGSNGVGAGEAFRLPGNGLRVHVLVGMPASAGQPGAGDPSLLPRLTRVGSTLGPFLRSVDVSLGPVEVSVMDKQIKDIMHVVKPLVTALQHALAPQSLPSDTRCPDAVVDVVAVATSDGLSWALPRAAQPQPRICVGAFTLSDIGVTVRRG